MGQIAKAVVKTTFVDRGWDRIKRELRVADGSFTKIGYPQNANPAPGESTMSEIIEIAAVHEFGAPNRNIPIRAHVRPSFDENIAGLKRIVKNTYNKIVDGKINTKVALGIIGEFGVSKLQGKIRKGPFTPLSPYTIAKKKSSKPLIDTAQMIQSVTHTEQINGV